MIGRPGDVPPCIRQRPFGMAGEQHGFPDRVRAPHCMGFPLNFPDLPAWHHDSRFLAPHLHIANHCLTTVSDGDMLDDDALHPVRAQPLYGE